MSVLSQRRVRVFYNPQGSSAPERPWVLFCPCCKDAGYPSAHSMLASWHEAIALALTHVKLMHCLFCIEREMPAGRDDLLGELFQRCPECSPACPDCDGIAVYPANYNTPTQLANDLAAFRLIPILCDGCLGVVALVPLDPEVTA